MDRAVGAAQRAAAFALAQHQSLPFVAPVSQSKLLTYTSVRMSCRGWARGSAASALLLLASATLALASPRYRYTNGPCVWTGTEQAQQGVCNSTVSRMAPYRLQSFLSSLLEDMLDAASSDDAADVSITLRGVNLTGIQLFFPRGAAFPGAGTDRTFNISIEDSMISKNQLVIFGALAAQAGLTLNVKIRNSTVADNQQVLAAGIASGKAVKAAVDTVDSIVRGNMMAAAGGLALSSAFDASATGSGGSATKNAVAAAGLIASGGPATVSAGLETVQGEGNGVLGAGLPFTEEPLVASIISTVMNAVFVDSSSLSTGLADTQTKLCASLSADGSLSSFAADHGLEAVASVAWELLCNTSSTSHISLAEIPGMLEGTAGPPAGSGSGTGITLHKLRLLAAGKGRVRVRSIRSALAFAANHPAALSDLLGALSIEEQP